MRRSVKCFLCTYCWVFDTARERDPAALPAGVEFCAVEVDVQVPVVGPVSSAAGPLRAATGGKELKTRSPPQSGRFHQQTEKCGTKLEKEKADSRRTWKKRNVWNGLHQARGCLQKPSTSAEGHFRLLVLSCPCIFLTDDKYSVESGP